MKAQYPVRYRWQYSPDIHLRGRDAQFFLRLPQSCGCHITVSLVR